MNSPLFPKCDVTKAFTLAYQTLGLNAKQVAEILGISTSSLVHMTLLGFESGTVEYRKQLAFIRMYHLLITLSEGNSERMKVWFNRYNMEVGAVPASLCRVSDGIDRLADYLRERKHEADTGLPILHLCSQSTVLTRDLVNVH